MKAQNRRVHPASFRNPSGFVFSQGDVMYRQAKPYQAEDYRHLMESGLYAELTKRGLLIRHTEVPREDRDDLLASIIPASTMTTNAFGQAGSPPARDTLCLLKTPIAFCNA